MESANAAVARRAPWNRGKLTGQKPPLKLREIWAIRTRLQMASNIRELAMFNLAIASKSTLRSHAITGAGHPSRRPRGRESHRHATKDPASHPIRDHGANP